MFVLFWFLPPRGPTHRAPSIPREITFAPEAASWYNDGTALGLGANHLTFTMAVVIGAASSFLTPVGHKANVLVFGPGGYRFFDYARVGALLTLLLLTVSMIFLPLFWPLFP